MKISFIGAGKVGTAFGLHLKNKGLDVLGYHSKTSGSASKAAEITQTRILSLDEVITESNIIFITTPDGEINKVCDYIADNIGFSEKHTVIHMSGALESSILVKANEQGANIFSLHPMQSFSGDQSTGSTMENTFFTMEGTGDTKVLLGLVEGMGNPYRKIESHNKPLYHGAACIASNYLVTLARLSTDILKEIGFTEQQSIEVIAPLMRGTLQNIEKLGVDKALTGPIVRGDIVTVKSHLDNLEALNKDIYTKLGLATLDIAKRRETDSENIRAMKNIFEGSE